MTLKDLIIEYRNDHGLSQRQFATACGLSNGYISMLEKEMNPTLSSRSRQLSLN
jgi:transcriptional regulator with XRE-family HTH domain